ncbi:MAG: UbiD family decarboxylase [Anaerolineaceae bacterium]|nr:UbiD family decarboxylase [Anaerolineaceae bacterium]
MSFRDHIRRLLALDKIITVNAPISKIYEIAGVLNQLEPGPVLFSNIRESEYQVIGNLFCSKSAFAEYFNVELSQIIPMLTAAINNRTAYEVVESAPCQEIIQTSPDLDELPILKHCKEDGGNYISAGVVISRHPEFGQNLDFHRFMQISRTEMAMRVVRSRHFDSYLQDQGEIEIAICLGNAPNILAAAATSVGIGIDELEIANTLEQLKVVRATTVDLLVPGDSEFILEGKVFLNKTHAEGPFVDLTGTYDIVRNEPVFEVSAITHRKDAIWQALLPGGLEHKLLMGMPREPTIFQKVNEVVQCTDVHVNPGGSSWLHAIIKINKINEDDGIKAIHAAFSGHRSCKHVFVVDQDIDIYDPTQVEWAMATRFQGDRDMVVLEKERGSSLDPSAEPETYLTTKIGFDLTKPIGAKRKQFEKTVFPEVAIERYVKR